MYGSEAEADQRKNEGPTTEDANDRKIVGHSNGGTVHSRWWPLQQGWANTRLVKKKKKKKKTHRISLCLKLHLYNLPWPNCSELTTSLVNVFLKFQTLISQICQYFLLKKCEKLLQCKSFSHFFNKNFSVFSYKVVKHLTSSLS